MNKKYAYICMSLLSYGIDITCEEPVIQDVSIHEIAEYEPLKFTDQITIFADQLTKKITTYSMLLRAQYDYYTKQDDNYAKNSEIPIPTVTIKKPESLVLLKKYTPDMNLTNQQKYIVAGTIACAIVLGVAYKYGLFSSSKDIVITAKEIQELVESVVLNVSIPEQDQLHKVFEVLIRNGLENIVVYNDHLFEVNDMYKVQVKERSVKVTRS